jgi:hypothetical protein
MPTPYETTFPCFCCGKDVKVSKSHHIVSHDGYYWMSHPEFIAYCKERNVPHDDPNADALLGYAGCGWRPETYGPSCYAREKKKHKGRCVEIVGSDGLKYLFIDEPKAS